MIRISQHLKKHLGQGDYTRIARVFNCRNKRSIKTTITPGYVQMLLTNKRDAKPGTSAEEVLRIAKVYLEKKKEFETELQSI